MRRFFNFPIFRCFSSNKTKKKTNQSNPIYISEKYMNIKNWMILMITRVMLKEAQLWCRLARVRVNRRPTSLKSSRTSARHHTFPRSKTSSERWVCRTQNNTCVCGNWKNGKLFDESIFTGRRTGGGARRGTQIPNMVPRETSSTWHGLIEGRSADLHTRATFLPRQALRLLLSLRLDIRSSCARWSLHAHEDHR